MPSLPPRKQNPSHASKWHAVSVQPGATPCDAVVRSRNARYLAGEAPRIPIPGCAWPAKCQCTYRHYADRRSTSRRIADRGMYGGRVATERRSRGERRRSTD